MTRFRPLRLLAGAMALALAALSSGPAIISLLAGAGGSSSVVTPSQMASGRVRLQGTLVALHSARRTGDLALANGSLVPLRFTSIAQERHLRVGDVVTVSADAHGRSRLLVRAVRVQALGGHWFGGHWFGGHWLIHGAVARLLSHGNAEVLGVHGAAVVVQVGAAHVTSAPQTGALFQPTTAYAAAGAAHIHAGEEIETEVTLTPGGTLEALSVKVVALRVARLDVEGTVTAVNRAGGTMTITDEAGQTTVVALGKPTATYQVGQNAAVSGVPTGTAGSDVALHAQAAEHESDTGSPPGSAGQATPTPADPPGSPATTTSTPTAEGGATSTPWASAAATGTATAGSVAGTATATKPITSPPTLATGVPVPPQVTRVPVPGAGTVVPTTPGVGTVLPTPAATVVHGPPATVTARTTATPPTPAPGVSTPTSTPTPTVVGTPATPVSTATVVVAPTCTPTPPLLGLLSITLGTAPSGTASPQAGCV